MCLAQQLNVETETFSLTFDSPPFFESSLLIEGKLSALVVFWVLIFYNKQKITIITYV